MCSCRSKRFNYAAGLRKRILSIDSVQFICHHYSCKNQRWNVRHFVLFFQRLVIYSSETTEPPNIPFLVCQHLSLSIYIIAFFIPFSEPTTIVLNDCTGPRLYRCHDTFCTHFLRFNVTRICESRWKARFDIYTRVYKSSFVSTVYYT